MGGSSSPPPAPTTYQYGHMGGADTGAFGGINQMNNAQNYGGQLFGNYGMGLGGMLQATDYSAQNTVNQGNYMAGQGMNMFGQGNQLFNLGMDQQHALYNQSFQQNVDQTRAAEAARGVAMTPYGAGLESQSNQQFNNLWQNQQAMRAAQLAQAAQGMYGQGMATMGAGAGLAANAPTMQIQNLLGLQHGGMNAYALPQQNIQNYLNYMSGGTQADQAATANYQAQVNAWKAQQEQQNQQMAGYGQMAGMAAMMMFSDRRLKTDIVRIGRTDDGQPIYRFRYLDSPMFQIGLMADDVEKVCPEAVVEVGGYKMVDYELATAAAAGPDVARGGS